MRLFSNHYFLLSIILIIFSSCSKSVDKDLSLTRQEYLSLGVPDCDKIWTQDNYIDAFMILNKLKLTKPSSLPRKNSKKSGKLFKRMISDENFAFLQTDTLSLSEKAYLIQYYSSIQNEMVRLYTIVLNKDQYYYQELIEIYIFGLNVTQKKLDLIVANDITAEDAGFESDQNRVLILDAAGGSEQLPLMPKNQVAELVMDRVVKLIQPE